MRVHQEVLLVQTGSLISFVSAEDKAVAGILINKLIIQASRHEVFGLCFLINPDRHHYLGLTSCFCLGQLLPQLFD